MSFPACKHRKKKAPLSGLQWLAAEPFRLFFCVGAVWSIIGASLWPLFYAGKLGFYPAYCHSHVMIEAFGGAFVVGFLGTAGPRMASAPKLTPWELVWLFGLHEACAISHLLLHHNWGETFFVAMLLSLLVSLVYRVVRFREEKIPPQLLLAFVGLACGVAGALLFLIPSTATDAQRMRLAGLLLYQGFLLAPVLGIGSFLFPRLLGADFGVAAAPRQARFRLVRAIVAAAALVGSFFLESYGAPLAGCLLRGLTFLTYLSMEVPWRRSASGAPRGAWIMGLACSLVFAFAGMVLAGVYYPQHISLEHLLYVGGFGLLILVVASRVLFGHSGDLPGFSKPSWVPKVIIFLALLAALTRMSTGFLPRLTVSHHRYAAWIWMAMVLLWLIWHRRRFVTKDQEEA